MTCDPSNKVCLCTDLAEVFMSENTPRLKEDVLSNFVQEGATTRIVFCTEAFGRGLDCPNISQIIHFSLPKGLEACIQARRTSQGSRDGNQSTGLLINTLSNEQLDKDVRCYV